MMKILRFSLNAHHEIGNLRDHQIKVNTLRYKMLITRQPLSMRTSYEKDVTFDISIESERTDIRVNCAIR